jgi:hypothetical protein
MEFFKIIAVCFAAVGAVIFFAILGGTLFWLLYPHIHALFPTAAENNIIAAKIGWWDSVCLAWLVGILKKSEIKVPSKK